MPLLARAIGSVVFALACLFSPLLRAADHPCAMGPVAYAGDIPDYFRAEVEQTLVRALEASQGVVLELRVESCQQIDCLLEPARVAAAAAVILARIRKQDRDYVVELVAHAVDDGEVIAEVVAECSVCGQRELLDMLPAELVSLRAKILHALVDRGLPSGDVADVETVVGEHRPRRLAAGRSTGVGLRAGGWLATALGVGGIGSGAALLGLDGREHAPTCRPELVDVNGTCPNVYTTATAGAVVLGLGVASLAVGVGLLARGYRRSRSTRVQLAPGGVQLRF